MVPEAQGVFESLDLSNAMAKALVKLLRLWWQLKHPVLECSSRTLGFKNGPSNLTVHAPYFFRWVGLTTNQVKIVIAMLSRSGGPFWKNFSSISFMGEDGPVWFP